MPHLKFLMFLLFVLLKQVCPAQSFQAESDFRNFFDWSVEADNADSCEKILKDYGYSFVRQQNSITIMAQQPPYYMDMAADSCNYQLVFKGKEKYFALTDTIVKTDRFVVAWYKNYNTAKRDLKKLCKYFDVKIEKSKNGDYYHAKEVFLPVKDEIFMRYLLGLYLDKFVCKEKCHFACSITISLI